MKFKTTAFFCFFVLLLSTAAHADDLNDHKATILNVTGKAKILKPAVGDWQAAAKGMEIEAGDQIVTQKKGVVELAYDSKRLNLGKIETNTKAEFVSIEPTEIRLSDGSFFNALDGLASGQSYKITTPTAVAAVRGTVFNVNYNAGDQQMGVDVFKDDKPGASEVDILSLGGGGSLFQIGEGNQAMFNAHTLQSGQINTTPVSDDQNNEAQNNVNDMREEGAGANNGGTQGQGNTGSNGSQGGDVTQDMSQGDFAIWLAREAGALKQLPATASPQDVINFLRNLGISPASGWDVTALVTDDFLRSFLGDEGKVLTREELLARLKEVIQDKLNAAKSGVFPIDGASGSNPA